MGLNLLDLPEEILQMIFQYCHDDRKSLIKLTEVNKYTKGFIESNSALMSHIYLHIPIDFGIISPDTVENFEACLKSSRKHHRISIDHETDRSGPNVEAFLQQKKILFQKYHHTITDALLFINSNQIESVEHVLRYLEMLPNLEELCLSINYDMEDCDGLESDSERFEFDDSESDDSINDGFGDMQLGDDEFEVNDPELLIRALKVILVNFSI